MYWLLLLLAPDAAPVAKSPFVVVSVAADRPTGRLVQLTSDFEVTIASRTGETKIRGVVSLRRESIALPAFPVGPQLILANGDRIAGNLLGGNRNALRFAPAILGNRREWAVPLSSASAIWLTDTPADTPLDPARYPWAEEKRNRDVLRLRNGDTPNGVLVAVGSDDGMPTFQFRPDGGEVRDVSGNDVAAVVFNPVLTRFRPPKGPFARVVLIDGSRLSLINLTIAADTVRGETLFGSKAELPLGSVVAIDVMQGEATYLSDLKPKKVEQAGFLGGGWAWTANRTVADQALRLQTASGVSTFDKGLGTHARTTLTYDLGGKYQRFESHVGLDPDAGNRGQAIVRVRADGKELTLPGLGLLTANKLATLSADVKGVKELTLEVDFGPAGGVRAAVNWADARLVNEAK